MELPVVDTMCVIGAVDRMRVGSVRDRGRAVIGSTAENNMEHVDERTTDRLEHPEESSPIPGLLASGINFGVP